MAMATLMNQKSTSVQNTTSENKMDNSHMTRLLTKVRQVSLVSEVIEHTAEVK